MSEERGRSAGIVLGLTMAETAILIVFVLLLALTALLGSEMDRRETAVQAAEIEGMLRDLELAPRELADHLRVLEDVVVEPGQEDDRLTEVLRKYEEDRRDADSWRELVRGIVAHVPGRSRESDGSRLAEADEMVRTAATMSEYFRQARIEFTSEGVKDLANIATVAQEVGLHPNEMKEIIESYQTIEEGLGDIGPELSPGVVEQLVDDAERWRQYAADSEVDVAGALERSEDRNDRLEEQVVRLKAQVLGGGGGTDHPSCWYDGDATVAYLFDVELRRSGFAVYPARAPQHEHKREELPLNSVRMGTTLTAQQFLDQTKPVYDWSVEAECRFFVRAFDLTAADQKELYKDRMRTLESRFYKNANPTGPLPSLSEDDDE